MELTDKQLEKVRAAARSVQYGSVTINITASSKKLDMSIQNRVREDEEFGEEMPGREFKIIRK